MDWLYNGALTAMYGLLVLSLLIAMIVMVAINKPERHWVGLILIVTLYVSGAIGFWEGISYVNWDVLGLILGMSIFSVLLEESGIAEIVAVWLLRRIHDPFLLFSLLVLSSGLISIALENVTVVLLFAPVIFKISKITQTNPVPLLIGVALSSNMAGSATMIGDPPAIITAGYYNLNFIDFIIYNGKPSMFFITLIPMIVSCLVYSRIWVKRGAIYTSVVGELVSPKADKVFIYETLFFLSIKIFLLSIRDVYNIPLSLAALIGVGGLIIARAFHRDFKTIRFSLIKGFEWKLLVFLIGVFMLSGAFNLYGLAKSFALAILRLGGSNLFTLTALLIWLSVAISAVLDNTPYVVTMLPVIDDLAAATGVDPIIYVWALLLGATLGGGITYIGASANLVAVRLLEKRGYRVSFVEFIKYSLPFNLVNIFTGWIIFIVFWIL